MEHRSPSSLPRIPKLGADAEARSPKRGSTGLCPDRPDLDEHPGHKKPIDTAEPKYKDRSPPGPAPACSGPFPNCSKHRANGRSQPSLAQLAPNLAEFVNIWPGIGRICPMPHQPNVWTGVDQTSARVAPANFGCDSLPAAPPFPTTRCGLPIFLLRGLPCAPVILPLFAAEVPYGRACWKKREVQPSPKRGVSDPERRCVRPPGARGAPRRQSFCCSFDTPSRRACSGRAPRAPPSGRGRSRCGSGAPLGSAPVHPWPVRGATCGRPRPPGLARARAARAGRT